MTPERIFEIHDSQAEGCLRLSLTGDFDLSVTRTFEDRLEQLREDKSPVRINLAHLDFIDSTGLNALLHAVGDARRRGWPLLIEPDVSEQVMRLFKLMHVDEFLLGRSALRGRPPHPGSTAGLGGQSG